MRTLKENKFVRWLLLLNLAVGMTYLVFFVKARLTATPERPQLRKVSEMNSTEVKQKTGMTREEYDDLGAKLAGLKQAKQIQQGDVPWIRSVLLSSATKQIPRTEEERNAFDRQSLQATALYLSLSTNVQRIEPAAAEPLRDICDQVLRNSGANNTTESQMAVLLLTKINTQTAVATLRKYAVQATHPMRPQAQKALAKLGYKPADGRAPN